MTASTRVPVASRLSRMSLSSTLKVLQATELWDDIANAAWACADPGVQYDTTINEWHTCPVDGRINASNPCVTGDTLVATTDGLIRIDQMLDNSHYVIGSDGEAHPVKKAFPTGVRPVYRLRTKAGYELKLTADHRVLTINRGDVPACELTKDDLLVLGQGMYEIDGGESVGSLDLDELLTEFLGLMVGDGCLMGDQETAMLTLSPDEESVASRVNEHMRCYKVREAVDGRGSRENSLNSPQATVRVGTSSRCVVDELKRFAILDQGSQNKQFTELAFRLKRDALAGVLRGLFTADGSVANYGTKSHYVALDSTSLSLLKQVQTSIDKEDYPAAQTQAKAIHDMSQGVSTEIQNALAKVGKGKFAKKK